MRATPTPRQRTALETLRYFAPLLRLMRCEVARAVWTVDDHRIPHVSSSLLGPGNVPPGVRYILANAALALVGDWLSNPEDEAAVNFDTLTGLVDMHRHGNYTYPNTAVNFWVSGLALVDPPRFAQPLAPLFTGTLDADGAAVLADWFDEQSADWATLATLLRTWPPYTLPRTAHVHDFCFTHTSPDTACWKFRVWEDMTATVMNEEWVIGLGVFGPDGLERAWHFAAPQSHDPVFTEQFWGLCPAPSQGAE